MVQQTINFGAETTGAGGDTTRSAMEKAQANFNELYGKSWVGAADEAAAKAALGTDDDINAKVLSIRKGKLDNPILRLFAKNAIAPVIKGALTATRASSATYINRFGVVTDAAVDEMREEKEGWLIEQSATNLCLYSEFNGGYPVGTAEDWGGTITRNGLTLNSYASTTELLSVFTVDANSSVSASCFISDDGTSEAINLKLYMYGGTTSVSARVIVNFTTDTVSVVAATGMYAGYEKIDDGLYRVWLNFDATVANLGNTNARISVFTSDGLIGYYGGFQLEKTDYHTSYIRTTSSAVTRSRDIVNAPLSGNSTLLNKAHSIVFNLYAKDRARNTNPNIIVFGNASNNGFQQSCVFYAGNRKTVLSYLAGDQSAAGNAATENINGQIAVVSDFSEGQNNKNFFNGVLASEKDTSALSFTDATPTTLYFAASSAGLQTNISVCIKDFRIYDFLLNEDEIRFLAGE